MPLEEDVTYWRWALPVASRAVAGWLGSEYAVWPGAVRERTEAGFEAS